MGNVINFSGARETDSPMDLIQLGIEMEQRNDELEAEIRALKKAAEEKPWYLDVADMINAYRVFPRLVIAGYLWLVYECVSFVLNDPSPEYATAGLVGVLTAALAPIMSAYIGYKTN